MSDTIISSMNICSKCKNANPEDSKFCMHCGNPLIKAGLVGKQFTISKIVKGKVENSVPLDSNFSFSKEGSDFKLDKANVEINVENGKISIKSSGTDVFLKIPNKKFIEIQTGDEFLINGDRFKIE